MRSYVYKRLGKFSLNAVLHADATEYRTADGKRKPIYEGRSGEVVLYYLVGDHKDLHLARVGSTKLRSPMALDISRHLGGKLPGPNGKAIDAETARNVLRDAIEANPDQHAALASFHMAFATG